MSESALVIPFADRQRRTAEALSQLVIQAQEGETGALEALVDEIDEAVFVVDRERNVLLYNRRAEAITGYARQEVLGRHCLSGIRCTRCLQSCGIFERGQIRGVPLDLIKSDGSSVQVIKSASVLRDGKGQVIGAVEVFREVPEEDQEAVTTAALERDSLAWSGLETMLSSLGRAFLVLDSSFNIQRASASFADLLGTVTSALAGRPAAQILGDDLFAPESGFRAGVEAGERREGWRATAQRVDGSKLRLSVTGAPLIADQDCDGEAHFSSQYLVVARPEPDMDERSEPHRAVVFEKMIARSQSMRRIFQLVDHLYDSDASVLITGESGTGKELLARAVHARSTRANHPFVAINCGALPGDLLESELFGHARGAFTGAVRDVAGRFEVVGEGTLFLDEIGDLPLPLQVKLLRVLQAHTFERVGETSQRNFEGRILAATNQDLGTMVAEKRFREDLFYRLNVVPLVLPPLRDRREDLELLIEHLLEKAGQRRSRALRLSPSAMRVLMTSDWPGNIRQLENALEYATAVCEGQTIHREDLPAEIAGDEAVVAALPVASPATAGRESTTASAVPSVIGRAGSAAQLADEEIAAALQQARYNRGRAARLLGISRTTLWRRMRDMEAS